MPINSFDDILNKMMQRRNSDSVTKGRMVDIRDRYNAEVVVPLPDVEGQPTVNVPVPMLIADTIDNISMRAASVYPSIYCPPAQRSRGQTDRANELARTRQRALKAAWYNSALTEILLPRTFRHLCGYGSMALCVVPDFGSKRARIEIRDPLSAYPEPTSFEEARPVRDVGFIYGRSPGEIMMRYPESEALFRQANMNETLWDVVEWIDEDSVVIGILGPRQSDFTEQNTGLISSRVNSTWQFTQELDRQPNRAGMVPAAIGSRVTLDRIDGQVSKLVGHVDWLGKLVALEVLAAEKGVFGDVVIIGKDRPPQLLNESGHWNDGRTGEANIIQADGVTTLQTGTGPLTMPIVQMIEQNFSESSGSSPFFSGQTMNQLRTGRAIDTLGSYSIDPRIQELHHVMQRHLTCLNEGIMAVEEGYWPNKNYYVFTGTPGENSHVEYVPSAVFKESKENAVTYPLPGADANYLGVTVAQAVGAGLMPKRDARRLHPLIFDEEEADRMVVADHIEDAVFQAFASQVTSGAVPLIDAVKVAEAYEETGSWTKAITEADRLARERQAQQAPPTSPDAQPGLAMPDQGAQAQAQPPAQTFPQPNQDLARLRSLIGQLNSRTAPAAIGR